MAINFPTSLDTLTNPTPTDYLNSPSHSTQHANANDILEALEAKVGIDGSAVATSHDYILAHPNEKLFNSLNSPRGYLLNGKIVPSVTLDNLTVAIKGLDGNDPSATNPVYCRIGDTIRSITAALSVTKNAATNWCNAGSAELAAKEIDYFVYLGYNATDGVVIGFSRIPFATEYDDFSATTTNEKYCAISTITNAAAGDDYENIGRFAATLSAGAGYTWTVPVFTNKNLIQRPIYETRWLTWQPAYSASGSMTYTSVSTTFASYRIAGRMCFTNFRFSGTTGGTADSSIYFTLAISCGLSLGDPQCSTLLHGQDDANEAIVCDIQNGASYQGRLVNFGFANWSLGTGRGATWAGRIDYPL